MSVFIDKSVCILGGKRGQENFGRNLIRLKVPFHLMGGTIYVFIDKIKSHVFWGQLLWSRLVVSPLL